MCLLVDVENLVLSFFLYQLYANLCLNVSSEITWSLIVQSDERSRLISLTTNSIAMKNLPFVILYRCNKLDFLQHPPAHCI